MAGLDTEESNATLLGVDESRCKDAYVSVFIPSLTREGRPVEAAYWRDEAVKVMSCLFGGATSVSGFGGWLDAERGGKVKQEAIWIVFSFINDAEWNRENVLQLREFLYRMGRDAQQGAVGLHVKGEYLEIPSRSYE